MHSNTRSLLRLALSWRFKALLATLLVTAGAACMATAAQAGGTYFSGSTCCSAREPNSNSHVNLETQNIAQATTSNTVVCVQEHVFPNWTSTSGAFFDNYECGPSAIGDSTNGNSWDEPVCWLTSSSTLGLVCSFTN